MESAHSPSPQPSPGRCSAVAFFFAPVMYAKTFIRIHLSVGYIRECIRVCGLFFFSSFCFPPPLPFILISLVTYLHRMSNTVCSFYRHHFFSCKTANMYHHPRSSLHTTIFFFFFLHFYARHVSVFLLSLDFFLLLWYGKKGREFFQFYIYLRSLPLLGAFFLNGKGN